MNREELLKNAKPILFNTEMVQAILEGRKTVTRRVVKQQPIYEENKAYMGGGVYRFEHYGLYLSKDWKNIYLGKGEGKNIPFEVDDILYVRETWSIQSMKRFDNKVKFIYKACDKRDTYEVTVNDDKYNDLLKYASRRGWQPSLFMPKEAARIFLKVTDVRLERLKDITDKEAKKEGVKIETNNSGVMHIVKFIDVWNSTIKPKDIDKYGWQANPWVWVIEFEMMEVENE